MTQQLLILGRQPALGLAELESLYGATSVKALGDNAALVSDAAVDFDRLGGSVKSCRVLAEIPAENWCKIERQLTNIVAKEAAGIGEGKIQLGLSVYGSNESPQRIMATGLTLKKAVKKAGRSVRLTPNQTAALSSAQVFHNHMAGPTGFEVVVYIDSNRVIVARTTAVQDIDAYTRRDRHRPKRDARVGMLPPKLAQIIINLAGGSSETGHTVLDPFCGTGVVLLEAALMGYLTEGTDIDKRMIDYSEENLRWLLGSDSIAPHTVKVGDATRTKWYVPDAVDAAKVDIVACETYLGKPFTTTPSNEVLAQTTSECNTIIKKFLTNIKPQLSATSRLCVAVPAWQVQPGQFRKLPLVDSLEEIGYNRVKFEQVRDDQLLYYREDQIVARQLLVLTKQ